MSHFKQEGHVGGVPKVFFEHLVSNNVGDIAAASNHQYTDFVAPHVPLAARYCIFSHMEIGSGVQR